MSKIKLFLTILSILIAVMPISIQAIRYHDNLVGLVMPPSIEQLFSGGIEDLEAVDAIDFAGMSLQLPILQGEPILFQNRTVHLIYTFTNPFDTNLTINSMDADVICVDHHFILGTVLIEPVTLAPKQTLNLYVTCIFSTQAIAHIATEHKGQDSITTVFKDYTVELQGIEIHMEQRKIGDIKISPHTIR
ncbi:MAG: hypothetical protein LBE76_02715 [Nitrososphaerota archaeon]|jgi:hypothetical protein|nr:hypothetical protein [Nitrososphaerota archaeon]